MLSSLFYPYFELDSESDIMRKKLNKLNDFDPFFQFLVFWSKCHRGCLLDRVRLLQRGV